MPHAGVSWQPREQPATQPHEYSRGGTTKILTLFHPASGQVRLQPAPRCTNAVLHPWLRERLSAILTALPVPQASLDSTVTRAAWTVWQAGLAMPFTLPHTLPPLRLLLVWDNLAGHKTPDLVLWLCEHGVMPFKLNQDRRHHIPRQQHKVTNWPAYEAGLRQRGSLTVWFTDEAIAAWAAAPRTTRGGQPCYSPLAILTALTLRAVFRLAYRQAEGLIGSIISLLGLALRVPDHTTLSRRSSTLAVPRPQLSNIGDADNAQPLHLLVDSTGLKLCGAGEWLVEKHGTRRRRAWRKLHLGVNAGSGQIVAAALTGKEVDDGSQVWPVARSGHRLAGLGSQPMVLMTKRCLRRCRRASPRRDGDRAAALRQRC